MSLTGLAWSPPTRLPSAALAFPGFAVDEELQPLFGAHFSVRRLKLVPNIIAWSQILLDVTMTPTLASYILAILSCTDKTSFDKLATGLLFFGGITALRIWASIRGVHKLSSHRRAERRIRVVVSGEQWLVVHSPRDEAMRLLETAAQLKPAYVTVAWARARYRGPRRSSASLLSPPR
jgi:hypothetical protein